MAEKTQSQGWHKWALIGGGILVIVLGLLAVIFVFALPSFFGEPSDTGELPVPEMPEIMMRGGIVVGMFIVGLIILVGVAFLLWELFFKKKELHIVKEHHKIIKESSQLNPVRTLGNLVLTGSGKIQSYPIGKIVGHTQIPVNFERMIKFNQSGEEDPIQSESSEDYEERRHEALLAGRDRYDFFAFITSKGVYSLPIFNLLETPKIFACYPSERTPDLVGDVEIYDVGVWKMSAVNLFVPGGRHREPIITVKEIEGQLFPIAHLGLIDYLGLIAQRGIEGDTSMQKWLQAKASTVNVKEGP